MFRIGGVVFRGRSLVVIALTGIFGIGKARANTIIEQAGISPQERCRDLDPARVQILRFCVERGGYLIEGDLRRTRSRNIKRLVMIRSFRGGRHRSRLPVRGQRTRTNAKTRKRYKSRPEKTKKR